MNKDEYQKMADFEKKYWWHRGKRYLLESLIKQYFGSRSDLEIIEIGCGGGEITEQLNKFGNTYGMDISDEAMSICRLRGVKNLIKADINTFDTTPFQKKFDLICALDVLEHIQDDTSAMAQVHKMLKDGGYFFINVPAHKFLWSGHDEALQHKRRYTRFEITKKLVDCNFEIVKCTYFVSFVFPAIVVFRTFGNLFVRTIYPQTSYVILPKIIDNFLTNLLKIESRIIKRFKLPIGTTIVVIAKKRT